MSLYDSLLSVGSIVEVLTIKTLVRDDFYKYKNWLIVAEAEVPILGKSSSEVVVAKVPIEEISPYPDFDPARRDRSWELRMAMCRVLLHSSDRRFLVIDHDDAKREVMLSLKQAVIKERTAARTDHDPAYIAQGFHHLQNLHYHLLKHPLGLGGRVTDWPALLNARYWREGILRRLQAAGCPAAREYDGVTKILAEENPCAPCSIAQKLRCFTLLDTVRRPYEQQAVACVAQASDKMNPRHYHYTKEQGGQGEAILVFMDERCRKVVTKSDHGREFTAATFFQSEDCDPDAPDERLKYLAERRKRIAPLIGGVGYSNVKICTPLSWGYR